MNFCYLRRFDISWVNISVYLYFSWVMFVIFVHCFDDYFELNLVFLITLHPSYSEGVGEAKIVHYNRVFIINEFDYTVS